MKLYDCAKVIRSKNAGPFTLTIDLMFDSTEKFLEIFELLSDKKNEIAVLYGVNPETVKVYPFQNANTIKISLPRMVSSGAPNDRDVYGSQQHFPAAAIEV